MDTEIVNQARASMVTRSWKKPDVRPPDPLVVVLKSFDWSDSVVHCAGIALITQ